VKTVLGCHGHNSSLPSSAISARNRFPSESELS
jgi:hypothetical protein